MKTFYQILGNSFFASSSVVLVWFALSLWVYTQTNSVLANSVMSGIYLVAIALTGIWFGSLVDHHKKKTMMMVSTLISTVAFSIAFAMYLLLPASVFTSHTSVSLWIFILTIFVGVIVGNIRGIALPTMVTILVPEDDRDKANGLNGTVNGVSFLAASIVSGFLLATSGMYWILLGTIVLLIMAAVHLYFLVIPENKIVHLHEAVDQAGEHAATSKAAHAEYSMENHSSDESSVSTAVTAPAKKFDLFETFRVIKKIPGLLTIIFFTCFNNFLGGVFMPLMDPYGLSLVSLQTWGILWGFLSLGFIIGGIFIAKKGLGKNPLKTLFTVNMVLWIICIFFAIQPSIVLVSVGLFLYMCLVPFIESSEQTVIQKIVPRERQGRVFGFAQSVESAASPLMAFAIGPVTQFYFIPFMTTGAGVELIGDWFGVGTGRGIALVFSLAGLIGLIVTIMARRSKAYHALSKQYLNA